jgi:hypothetical protein
MATSMGRPSSVRVAKLSVLWSGNVSRLRTEPEREDAFVLGDLIEERNQ